MGGCFKISYRRTCLMGHVLWDMSYGNAYPVSGHV